MGELLVFIIILRKLMDVQLKSTSKAVQLSNGTVGFKSGSVRLCPVALVVLTVMGRVCLYKREKCVHVGQDRKGGAENTCILKKGVTCIEVTHQDRGEGVCCITSRPWGLLVIA